MKIKTSLILFSCVLVFVSAQAKSRKQKMLEAIENKIEEKMVQAPVNEDVCFSPEGHCDIKLVRLIQSAEKSIDVAIYDINLDQVVHELLVKSQKIPVRFLVDRRQSKTKESLVSTIQKANGQVRFGRQRGIMHNKFIIVDGRMIMLGSFNFTNGAAFRNQENQLYLTTPSVIAKYQGHYEQMWEAAFKK